MTDNYKLLLMSKTKSGPEADLHESRCLKKEEVNYLRIKMGVFRVKPVRFNDKVSKI